MQKYFCSNAWNGVSSGYTFGGLVDLDKTYKYIKVWKITGFLTCDLSKFCVILCNSQKLEKIKHKQPVVDNLTAFHRFFSSYLSKIWHPEILLKATEICFLPLLNQSITNCVHLPKDTTTCLQVIMLCHVKSNNTWVSITCRIFFWQTQQLAVSH